MRWSEAAIARRRSGAAGRRRAAVAAHVQAPPAAGAPSGADRRGRPRRRARGSPLLKPGQRLVSREGDLWRWDGFVCRGACADRRRAAPRRAQPPLPKSKPSCRPRAPMPKPSAAGRGRRKPKQAPPQTRRAEARTAGASAARSRWGARAACRRRTRSQPQAARLSALEEAKARLTASRDEDDSGQEQAEAALVAVCSRPTARSSSSPPCAPSIDGATRHGGRNPRRGAGDRARSRNVPIAGCKPIAAERQAWTQRSDGATRADRDAGATQRRNQAPSARRWKTRPRLSPSKRQALIREVEAAEADRRAAADALAGGEEIAGRRPTARSAPRSKRMPKRAKELARAEERPKPPSAALPTSRTKSAKCWRSRPAGVAGAGRDQGRRAGAGRRRNRGRRSNACGASASGSARSICAPRKNCARSRTQHTTLTAERDDLVEAIQQAAPGHPEPEPRGARAAARPRSRSSTGTSSGCSPSLFGGGTAELQLIESEDPLEAGLEIIAKPPGKKPHDAVAAVRRRAGADRAGADLRGVPHQSGADLRAGRSGRAARRPQRRALLRPARRDDEIHRHALCDHHPQSDHHGAHEPAFGVTMAERGVSQLVSVDLEAAVKFREAV